MRREQGLSLIEVLIAVALLLLAFTPLLGLFVASRKSVDDTAQRTEALALARATMDHMVARESWASITDQPAQPHPLNPAFTVSVLTEPREAYLKDILVEVAWSAAGTPRKVELQSSVYRREGQL